MMKSPEFKINQEDSLPDNPEYLSKEGLLSLQKKLEDLKIYRQEIAQLLEETKEDGDLSENAGYQDAQERWKKNEDKIAEIEDVLSRAVIISKEKSSNVQLGSEVTLKKGNDSEVIYSLVGPKEADPLKGKISNESLLGSCLIGKKKGDKVEVITPNGKIAYTIIDVR